MLFTATVPSFRPLLLLEFQLPQKGPHPFCFENMWIRHKNFKKNVQDWWNELSIDGKADYTFLQHLKNL